MKEKMGICIFPGYDFSIEDKLTPPWEDGLNLFQRRTDYSLKTQRTYTSRQNGDEYKCQ